jgi:hypothetical protein
MIGNFNTFGLFAVFERACKTRCSESATRGTVLIFVLAFLLLLPAEGRAQCVGFPVQTNQTCTNNGPLTDTSKFAFSNVGLQDLGTLTVTNAASGIISGTNATSYGIVAHTNANVNNSGNISGEGDGIFAFNGNATVTNSGTISGGGYGIIAIQNATVTNSGNISGAIDEGIYAQQNATVTNSGTILGGNIGIYANQNATVTNSGSILGGTGIQATQNATVTNSGTISGGDVGISGQNSTVTNFGTISGGNFFGILSFQNATVYNSGIVSGGSIGVYAQQNATVTNSGTILGGDYGILATQTAKVTNSGMISGATGILAYWGGFSTVVNSGVIIGTGGTAIDFSTSHSDSLTFLPGSRVTGLVDLGVNDTVNFKAGSWNYTFGGPNGLASASVNTGGAPFVISGNQVAVVDPTNFAIVDHSLMDFTRAVSTALDGRASDAAASGDAGLRGGLGFAAYDGSASTVDDAFAQVMGYANAPNDAVIFKNPTMTAPDGTTVWAKGFYGERTQQADGPVLRNVSNFYGGLLGVDRLVQPDLRLGGFLGGGAINTSIDLNSGSAASDIIFAGVYGRKDLGPVFIDFALLGGHTGNSTTRNVNNNLFANGPEIATASFGGWFISPEIASGYRYDFAPGWSMIPAVRLRYLAASYDGFIETGSTANLTAGGRTLENAEERADVTLTRTIAGDAGRFQVGLTGGVLGQQRTGSGTVNAILLGQALAFATPGPSSITGGYAGVSLDWRMRSNVSMFAAAEYIAMTDSSNIVTGKAGLRVGF